MKVSSNPIHVPPEQFSIYVEGPSVFTSVVILRTSLSQLRPIVSQPPSILASLLIAYEPELPHSHSLPS